MAHIVVNSGVSVVEIWLEVKKVKLVSMSKHFSACEFNARLPHSHIKMMITTIAQNLGMEAFEYIRIDPNITIDNIEVSGKMFFYLSLCNAETIESIPFMKLFEDLAIRKESSISQSKYNQAFEEEIDNTYKVLLSNFSKFADIKNYHNWYSGYSILPLPYWSDDSLNVVIDTSAVSGTVMTQHFGEPYDINKIERQLTYVLVIHTPEYVRNTPNIRKGFQKKNSIRGPPPP